MKISFEIAKTQRETHHCLLCDAPVSAETVIFRQPLFGGRSSIEYLNDQTFIAPESEICPASDRIHNPQRHVPNPLGILD